MFLAFTLAIAFAPAPFPKRGELLTPMRVPGVYVSHLLSGGIYIEHREPGGPQMFVGTWKRIGTSVTIRYQSTAVDKTGKPYSMGSFTVPVSRLGKE